MKKGVLKRIVAGVMAIAMLGNVSVNAATMSTAISKDMKKVTTTYSPANGYHKVIVNGYEYHSQLKEYRKYNITNSYTVGGTLKATHSSHNGFVFKLTHNTTELTTTVYAGNTFMGKMKVW